MASDSVQGMCCEPRQARDRAAVAITICVAVRSEASLFIILFLSVIVLNSISKLLA